MEGFNIPRVQSTSNVSRRSEEDLESAMSDILSAKDVARMEIRQQWLSNVRDILVNIPDMEPRPEPSSICTLVHSLAPKSKKLKMPLLQEVKEVLKSHTEKPTSNFNNLVKRFYPVHEVLEKGFIMHRDLTQTIITEVHLTNLVHVGASLSMARLKKSTISLVFRWR